MNTPTRLAGAATAALLALTIAPGPAAARPAPAHPDPAAAAGTQPGSTPSADEPDGRVGRRLRADGRAVVAKLSCPDAVDTCAGAIVVTGRERPGVRVALLARSRFDIRGGDRALLRMRMTPLGRRVLGERRVRVSVRVSDAPPMDAVVLPERD